MAGAKQKRVLKSKEEVAAILQNNAEFQKKIGFIKTEIWPALIKASISVEDASQLLAGFNTEIMQEFLAEMKNKKFADLHLEEKLDKSSPKHEDHLALIALFKDMTVFEVKDYIEGLRGEIDLFKREEFERRTLDTLQTKWADEILTKTL